jgi:hypothetical protein
MSVASTRASQGNSLGHNMRDNVADSDGNRTGDGERLNVPRFGEASLELCP